MGPFDGLDVQVHAPLVLPDRGISGVGQWARRAVAQARHIVFISAEVLLDHLRLVAAVPMVDDLRNMGLPEGGAIARQIRNKEVPPLSQG